MAADPYTTLGVAKTASAEEIRRAYRKLAKTHHPDLNPGNRTAEDTFKAINSANDLLTDPDKRGRYDRGEIDAAGDPKYQPPPYEHYAQGARGAKYGPGGAAFGEAFEAGDYDDIFSQFVNKPGGGARRPGGPRRGRDRSYTLDVSFLDAVNGGTQRLTLPDGPALDVRVPAGIESGQVLRLKEKGDPGRAGGAPGDALIEVFVQPHAQFRREGNDIMVDLPVTLTEIVLGARVAVPTTTGSVMLSIPPQSANGARLRLRGKGIPARGSQGAGDQYVTLKIVLDGADSGLEAFLRDRADAPDFNPRGDSERRP